LLLQTYPVCGGYALWNFHWFKRNREFLHAGQRLAEDQTERWPCTAARDILPQRTNQGNSQGGSHSICDFVNRELLSEDNSADAVSTQGQPGPAAMDPGR
jgi:hypothetical protein